MIKPKDPFYSTDAWREVRYKVLAKFGRQCMLCGRTSKQIHVDHIKPRSKYPKLALVESNLQVLCADCNLGKSNKYEDDFRLKEPDKIIDLLCTCPLCSKETKEYFPSDGYLPKLVGLKYFVCCNACLPVMLS